MYIKTTDIVPAGGLKIETVNVAVIGPYIDCDNKNESLASLFKRAIVINAQGRYVLQVNNI